MSTTPSLRSVLQDAKSRLQSTEELEITAYAPLDPAACVGSGDCLCHHHSSLVA